MYKKKTEELEIWLKPDHYFQTKFERSYFSANIADPLNHLVSARRGCTNDRGNKIGMMVSRWLQWW